MQVVEREEYPRARAHVKRADTCARALETIQATFLIQSRKQLGNIDFHDSADYHDGASEARCTQKARIWHSPLCGQQDNPPAHAT